MQHITISPRLGLAMLGLAAAAPLQAQFQFVESGGTFRGDATNLAAVSQGADAIGQDQYGTPHFIAGINDGTYGNSNSWLAASVVDPVFSLAEAQSWVGVSWTVPVNIASFAFGRDNTSAYNDRSGGPYSIQVDQGSGWVEVGVLHYGVNIGVDTPSRRNVFNLTEPLFAVSAFRIVTNADALLFSGYDEEDNDIYAYIPGQAIDELEIYSTPATAVPEPSAFATLVGLSGLGLALVRRRRA